MTQQQGEVIAFCINKFCNSQSRLISTKEITLKEHKEHPCLPINKLQSYIKQINSHMKDNLQSQDQNSFQSIQDNMTFQYNKLKQYILQVQNNLMEQLDTAYDYFMEDLESQIQQTNQFQEFIDKYSSINNIKDNNISLDLQSLTEQQQDLLANIINDNTIPAMKEQNIDQMVQNKELIENMRKINYEFEIETKQVLQEYSQYFSTFQYNDQNFKKVKMDNLSDQQQKDLQQSKYWIFDIQYLNKNIYATCNTEHFIKLYDTQQNILIKELHGHDYNTMVTCIQSLNSNQFISGGSDKSIILWDIKSGIILDIFKGHTDWVTKLEKINNHQFLSASNDHSILLWDMKLKTNTKNYIGHKAKIVDLTYLKYNNYFISCSEDKVIKGWSLHQSNACLFNLNIPHQIQKSPGSILQFKHDYFITGHYQHILVWQISQSKVVKQFKAHEDFINKLKLVNSDYFISCSLDHSFSLYSIEGLKELFNIKAHSNQVNGCEFTDNQTLLSCGADQKIYIWN